jgi:hypothetical protein
MLVPFLTCIHDTYLMKHSLIDFGDQVSWMKAKLRQVIFSNKVRMNYLYEYWKRELTFYAYDLNMSQKPEE